LEFSTIVLGIILADLRLMELNVLMKSSALRDIQRIGSMEVSEVTDL